MGRCCGNMSEDGMTGEGDSASVPCGAAWVGRLRSIEGHLQSSMAAEAPAYSFCSSSHAQCRLKPFSQLHTQTGQHLRQASFSFMATSGQTGFAHMQLHVVDRLCRSPCACMPVPAKCFTKLRHPATYDAVLAKANAGISYGGEQQVVKHSLCGAHLWLMDRVSSRFSTVWCHPLGTKMASPMPCRCTLETLHLRLLTSCR